MFEPSLHAPFSHPAVGATTAVVAIHGFMGSPAFFRSIVEPVQSWGCALFGPLLPGHGGTASVFAHVGLAAWEAHVKGELARVRAEYPRLVLIGHSMGALFALRAAMEAKSNIAGIVAVAPALHVGMTTRGLLNAAKVALNKPLAPGDPAYHTERANGVERGTLWDDAAALPRYLDLFRVARETRGALGQVMPPVAAFFSGRDEVVSLSSARIMDAGLTCPHTVTIFPDATHLYYKEGDWASIISALRQFALATCP